MKFSRRSVLSVAAVTAAACTLSVDPAVAAPPTSIVPGDPWGPGTDPQVRKFDFRAMWIATVTNIDWPLTRGGTVEQLQGELIGYLDLAKAQNHNAVIFQVRPTADTFWPSELEPWSQWLTGQQGRDPGFDPLAFCIEQAHARGLEVHAWYNPFRVAMDEAGKDLIPSHPARVHPEWTIPYGGKLYYNPGLPEVQEHNLAVIMESVLRYDLDGVHFDDYFYPYPVAGVAFNDAASYAQYGGGLSLADWRRSNCDALVSELSRRIKQAKPHVQFGVSPFAVWRNKGTDPEGSDTTAGAQTYDDLYADTRKWVREEWLDYILPQVYWSLTLTAAQYDKVSSWWIDQCREHNVHLYIGQATYKVAANADVSWNDPEELSKHLAWNSQFGAAIGGNVYFSAIQVRKNLLDATGILTRTWYSRPALVPRTPWIDATPPEPPRVKRRGGRLSITAGSSDTHRFLVYRLPASTSPSAQALADARALVAILPAGSGHVQWADPQITEDFGQQRWLVSAADRQSNESAAVLAR